MPVFLEKVVFTVDDKSWGTQEKHELKGNVHVGVGASLGEVLGVAVTSYEEMTFALNKLPIELQEKLISTYKDIQEHLNENYKLN